MITRRTKLQAKYFIYDTIPCTKNFARHWKKKQKSNRTTVIRHEPLFLSILALIKREKQFRRNGFLTNYNFFFSYSSIRLIVRTKEFGRLPTRRYAHQMKDKAIGIARFHKRGNYIRNHYRRRNTREYFSILKLIHANEPTTTDDL